MLLTGMLPFSITERAAGFSKSHSPFLSHNTSNASFITCDNSSLLGKFTLKRMPTLHVKTELFADADGSSPPPPALSPANSASSHLPDCTFNQASSPSPPVIVAEIGSNVSDSSKDSSLKNVHCDLGFDKVKLPSNPSVFIHNQSLPPRDHTVPRINSLSSSSPSSSSSTSSSSTSNEYVEQDTLGLPILEKISRVLGSPKLNFSDTTSAGHLRDFRCDRTAGHSPGTCHSDVTTRGGPLSAIPLESSQNAEPMSVDLGKQDAPKSGPSIPTSKRKKPAASRKSNRTRKRKFESDSDTEFDRPRNARRISRGRSDAAALISRTKRTVSNQKSCRHAEPANSFQPGTGAEAAANRRYLESPFLCLCQSRGAVVGLSKSSNLVDSKGSSFPEPIAQSAALPAHVISPALRGLSVGDPNNSTAPNTSIPPNCPLNRCGPGDRLNTEAFSERGEGPSVFSGLSYRPSPQLRSRELPTLAEITPTRPWLCVFCGQDNAFLGLGSLYGPYWLSDVERLQLPVGTVDGSSNTALIPEAESTVVTSESTAARPGKRARSGVVTSTVTRAAAAQGRATVAKTGELRLVIKARVAPDLQSDVKECPVSAPPRVSSSGEAWFHLECLLWAPGTCVNGSGTITGLEEAVQLALDTTCSYCDKIGAILSCCSRGCSQSFHYHCALVADCQLNFEQFTILCKNHKISV